MRDFLLLKELVGESLREEELRDVDCYAYGKLGLFIPSTGMCGYAQREGHSHPSYMFVILFSGDGADLRPEIKIERNHYLAAAVSPGIPHTDLDASYRYYCVMIEKGYFEQQYRLYTDDAPFFDWKQFSLCGDILKTLNTFAFEYSKRTPNSNITLEAQGTLITHWIIRSLLGENLDMRAVSSNYAVGRAQQYMERHYSENITVAMLAEMGHLSESNFNRVFKKETGRTPIEYLIEVRIEKSKTLLRRKEIPITEIAMRCGFGSSAHFASGFKRVTKVSPSQYREAYEG